MFSWAYLFVWLPQPLKVTHFLPNHHRPFLKHVHTIIIYFFGRLLLCILFLTAALIQCKTVYPLVSHHTSTYSFLCLSEAMPVHFLYSITIWHFSVTYNTVYMYHKLFLAKTRKRLMTGNQ